MGVNYSGTYSTPRLDLGVAFMEHALQMAEFVGFRVLPSFRSPKKAADFSALTRETLLQVADAKRSARSNYNRLDIGARDKSFSCKEYGLESIVDDSERNLYASDFDAEDAATQIAARALRLQHEQRVADAVFNTTTFTGAPLFTDNSASPWATASTDIIGQVIAAAEKVRENTGMMANALIMGAAQWPNLLKNSGIKNQFPGAPLITRAMIEAALAPIFGLERLIIGKARKNTAKEGQTFVGADVWGDTYVMVARVNSEGDPLSTPGLGRTFLWAEDSPNEVVMEMYREEQTRGDVVRARQSTDEVIVEKNFGHLMDVKA